MRLARTLGINVRKYRKDCGLSQEALADEVGLAVTYVGQIERGLRNPTLSVVEKFARIFRVDPLDLLRHWLFVPNSPEKIYRLFRKWTLSPNGDRGRECLRSWKTRIGKNVVRREWRHAGASQVCAANYGRSPLVDCAGEEEAEGGEASARETGTGTGMVLVTPFAVIESDLNGQRAWNITSPIPM
jgi:transcriptional regulator with XRE-family HTH domain